MKPILEQLSSAPVCKENNERKHTFAPEASFDMRRMRTRVPQGVRAAQERMGESGEGGKRLGEKEEEMVEEEEEEAEEEEEKEDTRPVGGRGGTCGNRLADSNGVGGDGIAHDENEEVVTPVTSPDACVTARIGRAEM